MGAGCLMEVDDVDVGWIRVVDDGWIRDDVGGDLWFVRMRGRLGFMIDLWGVSRI